MKKLLCTSLVMFMILGLKAQNSETGLLRFRVSAGLYTTKDFHTSFNYSDAVIWGRYSAANYSVDAFFYRNKTMELGIGVGYQKPQPKEGQYLTPFSETILVDDNSVDLQYFTILPQVRFNWLVSDDELFELYSSVGLGLTIADAKYAPGTLREDETYPLPALHFNWIGMRFGNKVGGFLEFGFGTKGLLAGGLSYRL